MFEAIIFVLILFVFIATFIFWCCEKKRDLDTRIIGGAFIAYCFISVFAQLYLLPILAINEWDKRLSLQIQFTALVIGLTAAIIAFRNYQRKSGEELSFDLKYINNGLVPYINTIVLHNSKDKSSVIFAIDILIMDSTKTRIRIFENHINPIIIPAYTSTLINVEKAERYTQNYIPESFDVSKISCVCITNNGETNAKLTKIKELAQDFRDLCILPKFIINRPEEYINPDVPINATHWLEIIETKYEVDDYGVYGCIPSYYRLTGHFDNDVFYVDPAPHEFNHVALWLHGKPRSYVYDMLMSTQIDYESGYYNQVPDLGLMKIEAIEFNDNLTTNPQM